MHTNDFTCVRARRPLQLLRCRDALDCLECFTMQVRMVYARERATRIRVSFSHSDFGDCKQIYKPRRGLRLSMQHTPNLYSCTHQECVKYPDDDGGKNTRCVPCGWYDLVSVSPPPFVPVSRGLVMQEHPCASCRQRAKRARELCCAVVGWRGVTKDVWAGAQAKSTIGTPRCPDLV